MTRYLRAQYNLNDPALISIIDDLPFWSAPFGIRLLDKVHYKRNIKVLDIGSGFGFPIVELAMRLGSMSKVYGIDPSKSALDRIRAKCKLADVQNIELTESTAEVMPFENDYFDLIVSNNGLNNVQDLSRVLVECRRVSKKFSQLVFTFNTDSTFKNFYEVFREVLKENSLADCISKIDSHIYSKRRPLAEFKKILNTADFKINAIDEDEFSYHFSDGTAMLNHFFIKLAFLGAWKEIIPPDRQEKIFHCIEEKINKLAEKTGSINMKVPFITIDCLNNKIN